MTKKKNDFACCYEGCSYTGVVATLVADHERGHIRDGAPEKACPHVVLRKRPATPLSGDKPQHDTSHTPAPQTRTQRF